VGLEPEDRAQELTLFAEEVDGPASPEVLTAHLELSEAWRQEGLGRVLVSLVRRAPREDLAQRAATLLATGGRAEDLQALSTSFGAAQPEEQVRMLRALGSSGREEHLPLLAQGLKAQDPAVRVAAVAALGDHPASSAEGLLLEAAQSPEPAVRRAASQALSREREAAGPRNSRGVSSGGSASRMGKILQSARRQVLLEKNGVKPRAGESSP
jgi:hypothetical protein